MKNKPVRSVLSLALAAGLLGSSAWSTDSHACAAEPFVGSVCIMATPAGGWGNIVGYALAQGQLLPINQNQALFAIVGTTWGGNGQTNFGLPNLAGRVVMGSGTSPASGVNYSAGQYAGTETTTLTLAQLPAHNHAVTGVNVDFSKATATTTLSGLTTTTNLAGVPFTSSSSLTLNASTGGTATANPANASLGTQGGRTPTLTIYSDAAPTVAMKAGSISGTVSGTLSGTAPGTATGTATTTLSGTSPLSGTTAVTGSSTPVSLMQPYLIMNYYIATSGIFPSRN